MGGVGREVARTMDELVGGARHGQDSLPSGATLAHDSLPQEQDAEDGGVKLISL